MTTKTVILVDEKIRDFLPGQLPGGNVIITKDLEKTFGELLKNSSKDVLLVLVFTGIADSARIPAIIAAYNGKQLFYRIVGVFSEKKAGTKAFHRLADIRKAPVTKYEYSFLSEHCFEEMKDEYEKYKANQEISVFLKDMKRDQEDLIKIGRALSIEKNPDTLLRNILGLSLKITGADAGSIYLVEETNLGKKQIRFKYSKTYSKDLKYEEYILPYDTASIAGYVAVTGRTLNIPDVYNLSESDPVAFNPKLDEEHSYRTRSMLVVPMRNHLDEIIGVIQLINSKEKYQGEHAYTGNEAYEIKLSTESDYEEYVVPFNERYESLMEAVAGQAAIAIENNRMIQQIQNLFEEFVQASVSAIESRDEPTVGHSFRVARICLDLAKAINAEKKGVFREIYFSDSDMRELEYASLLHDYGKIYLDLRLFRKAKKLYPEDFKYLMIKLSLLYRTIERSFLIKEIELRDRIVSNPSLSPELKRITGERYRSLKNISEIREKLISLNEPSVSFEDPKDILGEILSSIPKIECLDMDGSIVEIFSENDINCLETSRGSLSRIERAEIESHVKYTYQFLSTIPWPRDLKRIPDIALSHHEKIDGSGYPNRVEGAKNIPLQARMITVADIFDALTAADRPYKKAVPVKKALAVLDEEAASGKLDSDLVGLFKKYRIYNKVDTTLHYTFYSK